MDKLPERDYYCNLKFQYMKIDVEKNNSYVCGIAKPKTIDLDWLAANPGQLFNDKNTVQERKMMLLNQRNSNCENNCYKAEDVGAISQRIIRKGYLRTHNEVIANPKSIDLTLGSDCNLTCTYCVKEYSSAWKRDLQNNGSYPIQVDDDRYQLNIKDKILTELSQTEKLKLKNLELITKELEIVSPHLEQVILTGGEPFLHNNLFNILTSLKSVPEVIIWSGLGVNFQRFKNILSRLSEFPNVILYISGENIEGLMELNRYGNKWNDFEKKINLIKEYKIKFLFHSVLSNLTIFGFDKFLDIYREYVLSYTFVYKPDFMAVYVMDEKSKESIIEKFEHDPLPWKDYIFKSLNAEPTHLQRSNLKVFLKEFSQRRQLNVNNLYPESFLKWVNDVV
jgi:organic radical activating enzyme